MSISTDRLYNLYITLKTTFDRILTPDLQRRLEAFNAFVEEYRAAMATTRVDITGLQFGMGTVSTEVDRVKRTTQTLSATVRTLQTNYDTSIETLLNQLETVNSTLAAVDAHLNTIDESLTHLDERVSALEYHG